MGYNGIPFGLPRYCSASTALSPHDAPQSAIARKESRILVGNI